MKYTLLVALTTEDHKAVWQGKELNGYFCRALHGLDVDFLASVSWLRFGDLFRETEGFVCAIMDLDEQLPETHNIRKDETVDVYRPFHRPGESIRHNYNLGFLASSFKIQTYGFSG